jgi:hypothetical protein
MGTEQIMYCVVALILGMLLANMLKNVCGCKVVEGQNHSDRASLQTGSVCGYIDPNNSDSDRQVCPCIKKDNGSCGRAFFTNPDHGRGSEIWETCADNNLTNYGANWQEYCEAKYPEGEQYIYTPPPPPPPPAAPAPATGCVVDENNVNNNNMLCGTYLDSRTQTNQYVGGTTIQNGMSWCSDPTHSRSQGEVACNNAIHHQSPYVRCGCKWNDPSGN